MNFLDILTTNEKLKFDLRVLRVKATPRLFLWCFRMWKPVFSISFACDTVSVTTWESAESVAILSPLALQT